MTVWIFSERGHLTIHEPGKGGLLVSTELERQFEAIRKVMAHGSNKHNSIDPPEVQIDHLNVHFTKRNEGIEDESGLPHKAHAAARALLLFYSLLKELD